MYDNNNRHIVNKQHTFSNHNICLEGIGSHSSRCLNPGRIDKILYLWHIYTFYVHQTESPKKNILPTEFQK